MKKIALIALASSLGLALQAQTVIDPLTGGLSGYTTTAVLDNSDGANGSQPVTFTDSSSGLQVNWNGTVADPEQALFLAPVSSFSSTFAVGDQLFVDVNVPNGTQSGSVTADFGLAIAATATPTAAGSGNGYNSRALFDWASISVRPPQSSIRVNTSVSGTVTTGSFVANGVPSSSVSELFIDWNSADSFSLGYVTNGISVIDETVTFSASSTIGAAIGFYGDMRDQGGITTVGDFSNLTIQPIPVPEPSTLALSGIGGIMGLFVLRRKK